MNEVTRKLPIIVIVLMAMLVGHLLVINVEQQNDIDHLRSVIKIDKDIKKEKRQEELLIANLAREIETMANHASVLDERLQTQPAPLEDEMSQLINTFETRTRILLFQMENWLRDFGMKTVGPNVYK